MSRAVNDYMFLYEHLMDKDIENQTFEYISSVLLKHFSKNDYLSVGTLLIFLMKQGDLPGVIQKMCSYYIIYDMFKSDGQNDSPFSQFLLSSIETKEPITTKITMIERNFLNKLLVGGAKEIAKQTPRSLLQLDFYPTTVDTSSLKALCLEQQNELPMTVRSSLINVIAAPTGNITESSAASLMEGLCLNDTPLKNVLSPQFLTIAPPLLSCDDELIWFDLTTPAWHKPAYDSSICSSNNIGLEAKRLITQAFKQALCIMDQQTLLTELEKDPNMVYHIGLTPTKLPKLVEKNPLVAIEILLKLMNSTQITEYFSVLVNMEMSLHSMEVVNRLTTSVDLPTEFVHLYISNCISTCETIKDKYMQSRLVRLVCVFLQSLIRNKIINVKELFIEVEAFCVEFSKIREAAGLYRLLKQLEIGETNVNNFNKVKE